MNFRTKNRMKFSFRWCKDNIFTKINLESKIVSNAILCFYNRVYVIQFLFLSNKSKHNSIIKEKNVNVLLK